MGRHFGIRKSLTISAVITHTQRNEMITHNTENIQIIVQILQSLIEKEFMFRVSHGISNIKSLTPVQLVGRHTIKRLC